MRINDGQMLQNKSKGNSKKLISLQASLGFDQITEIQARSNRQHLLQTAPW